jgi:hypothetical protein
VSGRRAKGERPWPRWERAWLKSLSDRELRELVARLHGVDKAVRSFRDRKGAT